MQHFRGNLTRIKKLIQEKLSDDEDLYGYQGISKKLLADAVELAYNLSQGIEEREDVTQFEVISLKRFGSHTNEKLKSFLEDELDSWTVKSKFNDFLNHLSH